MKVPRRPMMGGAGHDEKVGDANDRSGRLGDHLGASFYSSGTAVWPTRRAWRFPVQFLIALLSQKAASAAEGAGSRPSPALFMDFR